MLFHRDTHGQYAYCLHKTLKVLQFTIRNHFLFQPRSQCFLYAKSSGDGVRIKYKKINIRSPSICHFAMFSEASISFHHSFTFNTPINDPIYAAISAPRSTSTRFLHFHSATYNPSSLLLSPHLGNRKLCMKCFFGMHYSFLLFVSRYFIRL